MDGGEEEGELGEAVEDEEEREELELSLREELGDHEVAVGKDHRRRDGHLDETPQLSFSSVCILNVIRWWSGIRATCRDCRRKRVRRRATGKERSLCVILYF